MKLVDEPFNDDLRAYYLPHHCVFKAAQGNTKISVVFDASCKSASGISLNDGLLVGPTIQQDLISILLRFRIFKYVLVADMVKMYKQILIDTSQTSLQRILWRENVEAEVRTYELTTVTYGRAPASYLATRYLKYLADEHSNDFPVGSQRITRDFYVDDLLTGADSINEAKLIRDEIITLLRLGAFELSKWASNCSELLTDLEGTNSNIVPIKDSTQSSILGVHWNQSQDTFHFTYSTQENRDLFSKRAILSEVSRLFDPLGLLGPVIVSAKLILQELWQIGLHWDESVPIDLHSRWVKLRSQMQEINHLSIPRCVKFALTSRSIQIHGFCDASQSAYGACIYIRSMIKNNEYRTELLCSKSRVAPLKVVSLPRLELLAAVLLAHLVNKVNSSMDLKGVRVFWWSDSTIVLNWVSSPSRKWSTFVANRVAQIQNLTEISDWRHISSANNPADILSRGVEPQKLLNLAL